MEDAAVTSYTSNLAPPGDFFVCESNQAMALDVHGSIVFGTLWRRPKLDSDMER